MVVPSADDFWSRCRAWAAGLIVAAGTMAAMLFTERALAIVWDEGYTLGRLERIRLWITAMRDPAGFAATWTPPARELVNEPRDRRFLVPPPTNDQVDSRAELLSPGVIAWFWPFAREEPHGHPPFYAIVALLGDFVTPWGEPLQRARFGTIVILSAMAGWIFMHLRRSNGALAAITAAAAWVLHPQLFALGHYATYDSLLTSLWVGSILAFARASEPDVSESSLRKPRWAWIALFGVLLGFAADTKITGWLLPIPFAAWCVLTANRKGWQTLVLGLVIGVVVLYAFNPVFWTQPIEGPIRFWRSNLSRAHSVPISTMFLGQIYRTPKESLPWYNTLVWTVFATPVGFLTLAFIGIGRSLWKFRAERFGILCLCHLAFVLALRALPHAPGHDGVRQFLPAFGMLALLAGLGAGALCSRFSIGGRAWVGVSLVEAVISISVMMPTPLSYFSPIIGGLPGAARLGMEPTYYWDGLTGEALRWLNQHTPAGRTLAFATQPTSLFYLQRQGKLTPGIAPFDAGEPAWLIQQNRPGEWSREFREFMARARGKRVISQKLGVPLVWAIPFDEYLRIRPSGNAS